MKTPLVLALSIFVLTLASCGGGGGSASPAIPQSTSPSAEFSPRSLSQSEVAQLGKIVSTNQKSDETLQKLREALEIIAGRTLSADEVNTFYQFITLILSATPPTPDECEAGRILNDAGNACRLLTSTDCTANGQILNAEGTSCRALTIADCQAGQVLNHVGNACRVRVPADCTANDQVLSGGSCVSCSGDNPVRYENVCGPTTQMCNALNQILRGAVCLAPTEAECRTRNQRLNEDATVCRPLTNADCQTENKVLQHNSCVTPDVAAPTDAECRTRNQRLNEDATACRPLTIADCQAGEVLNAEGSSCRSLTNADCQKTGQMINEESNSCRPLTNADCEAKSQVINDAGNACRVLTDAEATAKEYALIALEYKRLYQFRNSIPIEVIKVTDGTTVTTIVRSGRRDKYVAERRVIQVSILFAIHGRTISQEDGDIWYSVQDEATAKHREILFNRTRCEYQTFGACHGRDKHIVTIAATTFTVNGKTCNIDAYSTDGKDSTKAVVAYWFENRTARDALERNWNTIYYLKSVSDECVRHFNGETVSLTHAELPNVRFQQSGDYFNWLAKAYPNGFLPFANVDYASGYYHYGIQYGTTIEDMNFGFRATDKGAYNAMFYKSLNADNHAFFSYDKSEDSLMVLGFDTDTGFYGKGKVRFTVSSNIINPEKKFGIGYSTEIHDSEFMSVLEYRQDSAVNIGFTLDYNL